MTVILTGAIASLIHRVGAITAERFDAAQCDRLLRQSYVAEDETEILVSALSRELPRTVMSRSSIALAEPSRGLEALKPEILLWGHRNLSDREDVTSRYATFPLACGALLHVDPVFGLGDETYVTAPALTWVLASASVDDPCSLEAAMELCGTYAAVPSGSTIYQMNAACTPSELAHGLREMQLAAGGQRVPGLSRARSMVPLVLAGSASPMETKVAILLTFPVFRGGWGIEGLSLNRRIDLAKEQKAIAGQAYLVIDGCVAARKLGYEYDSREFHDKSEREYRDRVRVTAAQCLGYRLLPLTTDVVMNEARFDMFGDEFARLTGKRKRRLSDRTIEYRRLLRASLGLPISELPRADGLDVPLSAYEAMGYGF